MLRIEDPAAFRAECARLRQRGTLSFVPTMGALHAGHLALVEHAKRLSEAVVVSIFVNPTQFGPHEDLQRYPRTLEQDMQLCREAGVAAVFCPSAGSMYAGDEHTRVCVSALTDGLCGAARPGHFDGVCTIVGKLLSLVGECSAVFGRKDYQQLKVVERMCADLFLPVQVIAHPTVREVDGLALSSRNLRLSPDERHRALSIVGGLRAAASAFELGMRDPAKLEALCRETVVAGGLREDYVSCVDAERLSAWSGQTGERALLAVAAFVGSTRLIDNVVLGETGAVQSLGHEQPS